MATLKNDMLMERTVEGSLNYYDGHKGCGTAADKKMSDMLGGQSYNILSNKGSDEIYFPELRHGEHIVDSKNRHTAHFFGARRRKFGVDERDLVGRCMVAPDAHPRERALDQRRQEIQVAQLENHQSWRGFRERCEGSLGHTMPPKRYSIHNKQLAHEAHKLRPKMSESKAEWMERRGETLTHSISAPSVSHTDPQGSLHRALSCDRRKEAHQMQVESAHYASRNTANTYSASMHGKSEGQQHGNEQRHCSVHRMEPHDFSVVRKNNHYSSGCKLTRSDPVFMRPRLGITHNSVKYDIVNNERKWFRY